MPFLYEKCIKNGKINRPSFPNLSSSKELGLGVLAEIFCWGMQDRLSTILYQITDSEELYFLPRETSYSLALERRSLLFNACVTVWVWWAISIFVVLDTIRWSAQKFITNIFIPPDCFRMSEWSALLLAAGLKFYYRFSK